MHTVLLSYVNYASICTVYLVAHDVRSCDIIMSIPGYPRKVDAIKHEI